MRPVGTGPGLPEGKGRDLDRLLGQVARGDEQAFASVYDQLAGPVYGLIRRVVRNPAQSEEVAQEVLLEVWRAASRFDPAKGSAATWVMTIGTAWGELVRLFRHDIHALTGAYAVNAIDDEFEREKFERHMRRCQQCAGEVRGPNETATRLAFGASMPPPAGMRDSLLSAISRIRQLPPVVDHRKPRARRWWSVRMPMLSYSLAMAAVGVAIAALIALVGTRHELDQARARNAALTAALSAPDSHSVTQTISSGGRVTLVYSLRAGHHRPLADPVEHPVGDQRVGEHSPGPHRTDRVRLDGPIPILKRSNTLIDIVPAGAGPTCAGGPLIDAPSPRPGQMAGATTRSRHTSARPR